MSKLQAKYVLHQKPNIMLMKLRMYLQKYKLILYLVQGVLDKIRGVDTDFQPWILQWQTCPDLQLKSDKFVTVKFRVENQCPLPQFYIGLPAWSYRFKCSSVWVNYLSPFVMYLPSDAIYKGKILLFSEVSSWSFGSCLLHTDDQRNPKVHTSRIQEQAMSPSKQEHGHDTIPHGVS